MKTAKESHRPFETYLSEINGTSLLSAAEERALAARIAAGDAAARDHLVRANLRLVVNIARHYAGKGLPIEDLVAEGNLGLLRAAEAYDPGMNTRFSTYASFWVKQSIRRSLTTSGRSVRLPQYANELVVKWRRAQAALYDELGRAATETELGDYLGLTKGQRRAVRDAIRVLAAGQVDEHPDGAGWLAGAVADGRCEEPGAGMAGAEEVGLAVEALGRLSDRESAVLRLRFGLGGSEPKTLSEIGAEIGCTRERVRQIEREALAKLREYLPAA